MVLILVLVLVLVLVKRHVDVRQAESSPSPLALTPISIRGFTDTDTSRHLLFKDSARTIRTNTAKKVSCGVVWCGSLW